MGGAAPLSRVLNLTNQMDRHVAFKVKTTAPKSYIVRPSAGTLKPRAQQEVHILYQNNCASANFDRFLVQALPVNMDEVITKDHWAAARDTLQEIVLNVVMACDTSSEQKGAQMRSVADSSPASVKLRYEELVQHIPHLKRETSAMEEELSSLRSARLESSSSECRGFSKVHMLLVALISFVVSYLYDLDQLFAGYLKGSSSHLA